MRRLLLLMMLIITVGTCYSKNYFYTDPLDINGEDVGKEIEVTVHAHFDVPVSAFLLYLDIPEGLELMDYIQKGSDMTVTHYNGRGKQTQTSASVYMSSANNTLIGIFYSTCYDQSGSYLGVINWQPGEYDEMIELYFIVAEDYKGGDIIFSSMTAMGYHSSLNPLETKEKEEDWFLSCDIDDDGSVGIADVSCLIDYLLQTYDNDLQPYGRGDTYKDGKIDLVDAVALLDFLFTKDAYTGYENQFTTDNYPPDIPVFQIDDTYYRVISDNEVKVYKYNGISESITIPDRVVYNGATYAVTCIGKSAFSGCTGLTEVTIPSSVTSIGSSAFSGCKGLSSVTIPSSVTSIGNSAFSGCTGIKSLIWNAQNCSSMGNMPTSNIEQVIIGSKVEVLPSSFVANSKITEVTIPNSVTSIGNSAFSGCTGLSSVTIPNSVTGIGSSAFYNCTGLSSVTIPSSVTSIGNSAFSGCTGTVYFNAEQCGDFSYNGNVFGTKITEIVIGDNVIKIPAYLAYNCTGLSSVTIPSSVTSIGNSAFSGCTSLLSVTIPSSVTSIGNSAFSGCTGLTEVTIPSSVTSIGSSAFYGCTGIKSLVWNAQNCTSMGNMPTSNIEQVIIGSKVEVLPSSFVANSKIIEVTIPSSVTSIGSSAFYGCTGIKSLFWNAQNCTSMGNMPTSNIEQVIIGSKVEVLPSSFVANSKITEVTIPNSVTSIGNSAFSGCTGLSSVTCWAVDPPSLGSSVFYRVPSDMIVFVPVIAVDVYQSADGWKAFEILPISRGHSLTVNLPNLVNVNDYGLMSLVLNNVSYDKTMHYVISDKLSYKFNGIDSNSSCTVTLQNQYGDIFGAIENIQIGDEDVSVSFTNLLKPQTVSLGVKTPDGRIVTNKVKISWQDIQGERLKQGDIIAGLPIGKQLNYSISLPQDLATAYTLPQTNNYTVKDGDNTIICQLLAISQAQINGKVKDVNTNQPLYGATISATQSFGDDITKTMTATTNNQGAYSMDISSVPTTLTIAALGYISQTVDCGMTGGTNVVVPDVTLSPITGAVVNINITYTPAHAEGEAAETQNWYSDYSNVDYEVYNKTTGHAINDINVQYPQIVVMEDVNDGDVLELTATSRKNAFKPVKTTVAIAEQKATATFNIMELGQVTATFNKNINPKVTGMLYDAEDKLVKTADYKGSTLSLEELADGDYRLITMGKSEFFNSIYDFDQLSAVGLQEGTDYVENAVHVESGLISNVTIDEVPFFDESKFYYTSEHTTFTVNKPDIVIGNYLTFKAQVDFKEQYANKVNDVQLIIDLPESCPVFENSVMVGASTRAYTLSGNKITIPLASYNDLVRFCAIPTVAGVFAPSAFVQFRLNGKTITQPIGTANYIAKDLSISVPSTVSKTEIPITGTAIGISDIEVFDNGVLIGQAKSLAGGTWSLKCELNEPYNLSTHQIQAKVTTRSGMTLNTEVAECLYDKNAIEVDNVTMLYYNQEIGQYNIVFDFIHGTVTPSSYYFFPYKSYPNWRYSETEAKEFTFVVDLTNNDTTVVSGVTLYIHTSCNEIRELAATYDKNRDKWVASSYFEENSLPVNVSLSIYANKTLYADRGHLDLLVNRVEEKKEEAEQTLNEIDELEEAADAIVQQMAADEEAFASLQSQIDAADDNDEMSQLLVQWLTQAGIESSTEDFTADIPDTVDKQYIQSLINKGQELLDSGDDTDYTEVVDALLEQVDEALKNDNRFDYIASLRSAQSDTITIDTENGTATIFRTTVEKYGDIPFEIADSVYMEMNDGSSMYIYLSADDEMVIIDSLKNSVWYMNAKQAAQIFAKAPMRARGDFVAAMNAAIHNLQTAGNTVLDIASEWIKDREAERAAQEALMKSLEQKQAVLWGENAGLQIRITEIEKELQALTSKDVISVEEYFGIIDRDEMVNRLKLEKENVLKKIQNNHANINELNQGITRCGARIVAIGAFIGQLYELYNVGQSLFATISYAHEAIQDHARWYSLINNILPCEDDYANAVALKNRCESNWSEIAWGKGYYPAIGMSGLTTLINGYMLTNKANDLVFVVRVLVSAISEYVNSTAKVMFQNACNASWNWYPARYAEYLSLKCEDKDKPDKPKEPDDKKEPRTPRTHPMLDPSGFVYEGVPSNRLEGVTATCYYKETVEDMYGDLHENVVLWDAAQYGQENPLLTDENGYYRWDVPVGLWQVKYEKEGYETTYSDWLPVPPPQLDVNIGMVQMRQPEVVKAHAYPKAVEFEFDKFMLPETLTTDNIKVSVNGTAVSGSIELLNAEVDDPNAITSIRRAPGTGLTLASRVRFNADKPFNANQVTLHVYYEVESYANLMMNEDYEAVLPVELEMTEIVADSVVVVPYLESKQLTVAVLPAAASAGKVINVTSTSSMIATTDAEQYTLDSNGEAVITVHGDLPGMTSLLYSIDGYDLSAATLVKVLMESEMTVATPTASIASGSQVEKGTAVYLFCQTEGATIYYTLDGSCPCDPSDARKVYDGSPIIINGNVTIKAMATADGLYDSDVATFIYRVPTLKGDVNGDGAVNIADINKLIDYILGGKINSETMERGDVDGDNTINIADINAVIQIILGPGTSHRAVEKVNTIDLLHLNNLTLQPGETGTLSVTVDNAVRYSALQCDIVLPDGLTLVNATATGGSVVETSIVDENTSRALTYSMTLLPFIGDSQPVLTLTVQADAALSDMSIIALKDIVLADMAGVAWYTGDCTAMINNASGIFDLTAGADKQIANVRYYNVAGQEMARPEGVTIQVTTYTDGTHSTTRLMK